MANARMSLSAIFGAIQTTAATVTNSLDAINAGVGMINKVVDDAAYRQNKRSDYDLAMFEITLDEEKTQELAMSRLAIGTWMEEAPSNKDAYDQASADLKAAIASRKKK